MKTSRIILLIGLSLVLLGIVATLSNLKVLSNSELTTGDGNTLYEIRNISAFNKLELNDKINVSLKQGQVEELHIEADSNLLKFIITKVEDSTLIIELSQRVKSHAPLKAEITAVNLTKINTNAGAFINSEGPFKTKTLRFNAGSGARFNLELDCEELQADASSGAHGKISGKTQKLEANASSGGNIDAKKLIAQNANADASSGGQLLIYVNGNLDVKASSGGNIKYYGNPNITNSEANSGGNISKKD